MRIGIMGGTFDPPHLGHLIPVEVAASEFALERVWFVPNSIPPHKRRDDLANVHHRTAMLALALQRYHKFLFSPLELLKDTVTYTVDTVREFKETLGAQDEIFFIMGSDSFLEIRTWREYEKLLRLCDLVIINRGTIERDLREHLTELEKDLQLNLQKTIHFSISPFLAISSTEIRRAIQQGKDVSRLLVPEVESYIRKHSLYERR